MSRAGTGPKNPDQKGPVGTSWHVTGDECEDVTRDELSRDTRDITGTSWHVTGRDSSLVVWLVVRQKDELARDGTRDNWF